jgi:hypothetical protein
MKLKRVAFMVEEDAIFRQLGLCYQQWPNLAVTRSSWIFMTRNQRITHLLVRTTIAIVAIKEEILLLGHQVVVAASALLNFALREMTEL